MQTPVIEEEIEEQIPQCKHHWLIESPHGATSAGRCKICGEEREFRNSAADTLWEGDPMSSAGRMSGGASKPVVSQAAARRPEE